MWEALRFQPITDQVNKVNHPVIGRARMSLLRAKNRKRSQIPRHDNLDLPSRLEHKQTIELFKGKERQTDSLSGQLFQTTPFSQWTIKFRIIANLLQKTSVINRLCKTSIINVAAVSQESGSVWIFLDTTMTHHSSHVCVSSAPNFTYGIR